jgi:hypothetical protein
MEVLKVKIDFEKPSSGSRNESPNNKSDRPQVKMWDT